MITHSFNGSLSSKGPTFSKNSYMLMWRTCRLRQLEIKMSLSVIHCMSSDSIWEWTAGTSTQQIHMGYIYKVNTYGYKVDWWDWQSGSRNRWCKAYEGFYYIVGKKKTDIEQMSTREHPISDVTGWSKIDIYAIFNNWDTPTKYTSPKWPPTKNKVDQWPKY